MKTCDNVADFYDLSQGQDLSLNSLQSSSEAFRSPIEANDADNRAPSLLCSNPKAIPKGRPGCAITDIFKSHPDMADMIRMELLREREWDMAVPQASNSSQLQIDMSGGNEVWNILASWLVEVSTEFNLHQETLFLSVSLLHNFLLKSEAIPRSMLQLVAVSCMFVACKQEEVCPPSLEDFIDIAANSFLREDMTRMEVIVLDTLGWRLKCPTSYSFLIFLLHVLPAEDMGNAIRSLTVYIMELALLERALLELPPSLLACGALSLAHLVLGKRDPTSMLLHLTGHAPGDLKVVSDTLRELHRKACHGVASAGAQYMIPIKDKYMKEDTYKVAGLEPLDCAGPTAG